MTVNQALQIVYDLAEQNQLNKSDLDWNDEAAHKEADKQAEALGIVEDFILKRVLK